MSTKKIFKISIRQVKAARELLGWKQTNLAEVTDLSIVTIRRLEAQEGDLGGREETPPPSAPRSRRPASSSRTATSPG